MAGRRFGKKRQSGSFEPHGQKKSTYVRSPGRAPTSTNATAAGIA
jgi:hypothetical protein